MIVVDDGSPDGAEIQAVAERFGARYVRHSENRGAAAARNTGLGLAADPVRGVPRLRLRRAGGLSRRAARSPSGSGGGAGRTADRIVGWSRRKDRRLRAMSLRRSTWVRTRRWSGLTAGCGTCQARQWSRGARRWRAASTRGSNLREDVDLVWRLHDPAGRSVTTRGPAWRTRTGSIPWPGIGVESRTTNRSRHCSSATPSGCRRCSSRRCRRSSGGPRSEARGPRWSRSPRSVRVRLRRTVSGRVPGVPRTGRSRRATQATMQEARQLARALMGPWAPAAVAAVCVAPRRRGLAVRLGALIAAGIVADWVEDRPRLDPLTYVGLRLAEESARGVGIWSACIRARDFRALRAPAPAGSEPALAPRPHHRRAVLLERGQARSEQAVGLVQVRHEVARRVVDPHQECGHRRSERGVRDGLGEEVRPRRTRAARPRSLRSPPAIPHSAASSAPGARGRP